MTQAMESNAKKLKNAEVDHASAMQKVRETIALAVREESQLVYEQLRTFGGLIWRRDSRLALVIACRSEQYISLDESKKLYARITAALAALSLSGVMPEPYIHVAANRFIFSVSCFIRLEDLPDELRELLCELEEHEKLFWSGCNKLPDEERRLRRKELDDNRTDLKRTLTAYFKLPFVLGNIVFTRKITPVS